jgi:hypothetical protein
MHCPNHNPSMAMAPKFNLSPLIDMNLFWLFKHFVVIVAKLLRDNHHEVSQPFFYYNILI